MPPGAAAGGGGRGGGLAHATSMPAMKNGGGGGGSLTSQGSAPSNLLNSGGSATNLGPSAPSSGGTSGFATSLNLETLLAAGSNQNIVVPDADVVDKVHFVVNNLSTQNMADKAAEVRSRISPEQYPWFAVYLVVKRASIEPNFHSLYIGLLDAIADATLFRLVLDASYSNVKALLSSSKVKTNSGERSLLKNLGSWLGQLTIARNKPVLMNDLDVKGLILESYQTGHMIAVIPFIAKVLEPAKDSIIFKTPNPWTVAVLALLKEIYNERDLKLNLKFEMERLFKHLDVDIKDAKPSYLLHQRQRDRVNNPDFVADKNARRRRGWAGRRHGRALRARGDDEQPRAARREGAFGQQQSALVQQQQQQQQAGGRVGCRTRCSSTSRLRPRRTSPRRRASRSRGPSRRAHRGGARDRLPVVERSVTIACMTARELVLKDFAVEPDAARVRKAAHLMVSSLAGSLALVTCREPLKASVASQLRAMLQQAGVVPPAGPGTDVQALDQAVQSAVVDNLELGCSLIEQAATERAVRDIDEALAPAVLARQKHREKHGPAGQPFFDPAYLQGRFPGALPESLRPRPGHLAPAPQRIYEDFASPPRAPPPPGRAPGVCLSGRRAVRGRAPAPPAAERVPRPAPAAAARRARRRARRPGAPPRAPRARRSGRSIASASRSRGWTPPRRRTPRGGIRSFRRTTRRAPPSPRWRRRRRRRRTAPPASREADEARVAVAKKIFQRLSPPTAEAARAARAPRRRPRRGGSTARRAPRRSRRWLATGRAASFSAR